VRLPSRSAVASPRSAASCGATATGATGLTGPTWPNAKLTSATRPSDGARRSALRPTCARGSGLRAPSRSSEMSPARTSSVFRTSRSTSFLGRQEAGRQTVTPHAHQGQVLR
jgi:hypothetical protein